MNFFFLLDFIPISSAKASPIYISGSIINGTVLYTPARILTSVYQLPTLLAASSTAPYTQQCLQLGPSSLAQEGSFSPPPIRLSAPLLPLYRYAAAAAPPVPHCGAAIGDLANIKAPIPRKYKLPDFMLQRKKSHSSMDKSRQMCAFSNSYWRLYFTRAMECMC